MPIQNLTKENFFNALEDEFPDAVSHFCKWIDEYKKEVKWNELFGAKVKFHDLPLEMQKGIIGRFEFEMFNNKSGEAKEKYARISKQYRNAVHDIFSELQHRIIRRTVNF